MQRLCGGAAKGLSLHWGIACSCDATVICYDALTNATITHAPAEFLTSAMGAA
jgi:hypothetical protein